MVDEGVSTPTEKNTTTKKAATKKVAAKKVTAKKVTASKVTEIAVTEVEIVQPEPAKGTNKDAVKALINDLKLKTGASNTGEKASIGATSQKTTVLPRLSIPTNIPLMAALQQLRAAGSNPSAVVAEAKKDTSVLANLTLRSNSETKETSWEVYLNDASKAYSSKFTSSKSDVFKESILSQDMSKWLNSSQTYSVGLIPDGVKFIHKHGNRMRIVLEIPPGKYLTFWGRSESSSKETYMLGCPYKVVIADFISAAGAQGEALWSLFGARAFFTLEPMQDWNLPLYHVTFNNTNCKGYGGTSIGWHCFYHHGENKKTLKGIINVIHHRIGGGEAYNEVNMPGTQGTNFYRTYRPNHTYLHSPAAWEKKTEDEGIDWVWDPEQWIGIIPDTEDLQQSHDINKRNSDQSQLTIGRAVFSHAPMYYPGRGGETPEDFYKSLFNNPYVDYTPKQPVEPINTFDKLFL